MNNKDIYDYYKTALENIATDFKKVDMSNYALIRNLIETLNPNMPKLSHVLLQNAGWQITDDDGESFKKDKINFELCFIRGMKEFVFTIDNGEKVFTWLLKPKEIEAFYVMAKEKGWL